MNLRDRAIQPYLLSGVEGGNRARIGRLDDYDGDGDCDDHGDDDDGDSDEKGKGDSKKKGSILMM